MRSSIACLFTLLICPCVALAQPGFPPRVPESQPAPVQPPATAPQPRMSPAATAPADDPVVVGRMEHMGWSLTGPRAKHYIFGGLAVADYVWQGKRRIVTLQEYTDLPKPYEDYLYYRELRDGNWWAFRKHPWPDRTYSVWFRSASAPAGSKWQRFQRARIQVAEQ
jgi:hypothetical protein